MVLVTNIYGEAAQLEETVRKDSRRDRIGLPPRGRQGWVRLAPGWLSGHTSHTYCQEWRDPGDKPQPKLLRKAQPGFKYRVPRV